jgi:hypothetical protein
MDIRFDCSPHFHIHWVGKDLDWECFDTIEEARMRAGELARPGEIFAIEEVSMNCPMQQQAPPRQDQSESSN